HLGLRPPGCLSPPPPAPPRLQPERSWHPPAWELELIWACDPRAARPRPPASPRLQPERSWHPPAWELELIYLQLQREAVSEAPPHPTIPLQHLRQAPCWPRPPPSAEPCKSQPAGSRPTAPWPCQMAVCIATRPQGCLPTGQ
ncbi:hypothetical protein P7K49_013258, partial [Saguinus oedipus]